ncbi:hypothetical protein [Nocardia africana]
MFTVLAALSGMEREYIRDRTLEGHESARKRGKAIGGATVVGDDMLSLAVLLRDQGHSLRDIAGRLVIAKGKKKGQHPSAATVMRMLRDHDQATGQTITASSDPGPAADPRPAHVPAPPSRRSPTQAVPAGGPAPLGDPVTAIGEGEPVPGGENPVIHRPRWRCAICKTEPGSCGGRRIGAGPKPLRRSTAHRVDGDPRTDPGWGACAKTWPWNGYTKTRTCPARSPFATTAPGANRDRAHRSTANAAETAQCWPDPCPPHTPRRARPHPQCWPGSPQQAGSQPKTGCGARVSDESAGPAARTTVSRTPLRFLRSAT